MSEEVLSQEAQPNPYEALSFEELLDRACNTGRFKLSATALRKGAKNTPEGRKKLEQLLRVEEEREARRRAHYEKTQPEVTGEELQKKILQNRMHGIDLFIRDAAKIVHPVKPKGSDTPVTDQTPAGTDSWHGTKS
jgi:hypothetical protein